MSSLQQPLQQQQPQQQQPVLVYPNNVSNQPSTSHHSNGSFGGVFIVLAVIIVISAIACFLGRLCNRHLSNSKPSKQAAPHNLRPKKEGAGDHHHQMEFGDSNSSFRPRDPADIEFGFDKKIPSAGKSKGNIGIVGKGSRSEGRGHMNHNKPYNGNGDHHHMNGEMKQPEGDHTGFGEPRSSG